MTQISQYHVEINKLILIDYLEENHPNFHKELIKSNQLEQVVEQRAKTYITKLVESKHPELDKEVFFQEMMTF